MLDVKELFIQYSQKSTQLYAFGFAKLKWDFSLQKLNKHYCLY